MSPGPLRGNSAGWLLGGAVVLSGFLGCVTERERGADDGVHPDGIVDPESADFHGTDLRARGYPLAECRGCHGQDDAGGPVGASCLSAGCHTEGVDACGTCHDASPATGAHPAHAAAVDCASCHPVRDDTRHPDHPGGRVEVEPRGLATAAGATARWNAEQRTCSDVYCHGDSERRWDEGGPLGCGGCHDAPPESHSRFADGASDCTSCHGDVAAHLDGTLDRTEPSCDTCHGTGPLGAPPDGLLGVESGSAVGAHARHLDALLPDRVGPVAACEDCHEVPAAIDDPGHVDQTAPADVVLDGTFDVAGRTCVVGCHFDSSPGPGWNDGAAARSCDACHGMPPAVARDGTPHPPSVAEVGACTSCHPFGLDTHVDGAVDVVPLGCDGCHGEGPLGAPPPGLFGEDDHPAIGAHARHLDPTIADRIGRVARCTDCHVVPDAIDADGHIDGARPADVRLRLGGVYEDGARTCVSGCHWDRDPGPAWDDDSGAARACDACHAMPPATTRTGTAHPPSAPDTAVCAGCHVLDPTTHVDGVVDLHE